MKITRPQLFIGGIGLSSLLFPATALAHCPLCTAGAGLVAIGAYWLGVNGLTIGVILGAFALALGLWIARLIKKKYLPQQDNVVGIFSWLTTILPLKMLLSDYTSIYLNWGGSYGSLFNRTYPINLFLVGGVVGGMIIYFAPAISRTLTERRGKTAPYQGMIVTFVLLILTALITQFII